MTSMGLRAKKPQPPATLRPGEQAVVHPPAVLKQRQPQQAPPQNMIRDLIQRLRQQPTPADLPAAGPADGPPMKSVLRQ